jgi:hypothetical protein
VDSFSDPGDAHDDEQLAKEDSLGSMLRFLKNILAKKERKLAALTSRVARKMIITLVADKIPNFVAEHS